MPEINLNAGKIHDIVDLMLELEDVRWRLSTGQITHEQAKLELAILSKVLQAAGVDLQYARLLGRFEGKAFEGSMPVMQRGRRLAPAKNKASKSLEEMAAMKDKPNGSPVEEAETPQQYELEQQGEEETQR